MLHVEGTLAANDFLDRECFCYALQEELKILRLRYSLLVEEELNNREEVLSDLLQFKTEMKVRKTRTRGHMQSDQNTTDTLMFSLPLLNVSFSKLNLMNKLDISW